MSEEIDLLLYMNSGSVERDEQYEHEISVIHNPNLVSNCMAWLIQNNIDWTTNHIGIYVWKFGFEHKKDAMLFKLVWG